jgi:hypothetical protein
MQNHFKYTILALSLLSLTLLYLLTSITTPPTITLDQTPTYDGQRVTIQATIQTIQNTKNNAQILTLTQPNTTTTLTIYLTTPQPLQYGDTIQTTGTITRYQNTYELQIDTTTPITILHHHTGPQTPLWQLAQNPTHYQDTTITTTGTVDKTTQTTFTLKDTTTPTTITVTGATTQPPKNSHITIHARLLYDTTTFHYTLQLINTTSYTIQGDT